MKTIFSSVVAMFVLATILSSAAISADTPLGGMRLLPGYVHQPLQGFDSVVGKVSKDKGLEISYEIGSIPQPGGLQFGGQFSDRPKLTPKAQLRWYLEQTVNNQPVHLAYGKDNLLQISFPQKGMNFSTTVRSADEMAEALLMILTYADTPAAKGAEGGAK